MHRTAFVSTNLDDDCCWRGFRRGDWSHSIGVRDFIIRNVSPYGGDETFLESSSRRTKAVWEKLQPYFQEEQKKGVLAVDAETPSTLLAHQATYIDRDNEVIAGLQTDQPFKRAIFPFGGLRMVEAGLKAAGFEADPQVHEAFTKYRKTTMRRSSTPIRPRSCNAGSPASSPAFPMPMAAAASSATTGASRFTAWTGCLRPSGRSGRRSTTCGPATT